MISFLLTLWIVFDAYIYICMILDWKNFKKQVLENWQPSANFYVKLTVAILTILFLGPIIIALAIYKCFKNPA